MAYKTFIAGEEALAADVNSYLMSQTVSRFASAAARTAAITAPVLNQLTMRDDRPGVVERWNGIAWVNLSTMFHVAITNNVVISNTTAAASQDLVNTGAQSYDGTPVVVEFSCAAVALPAVAGSQVAVNLFDGSTDLGYFGAVANPANGGLIVPMFLRRIITPTVGIHTYHATAWVAGGPCTFYANTGAASAQHSPMLLSFTKVT